MQLFLVPSKTSCFKSRYGRRYVRKYVKCFYLNGKKVFGVRRKDVDAMRDTIV